MLKMETDWILRQVLLYKWSRSEKAGELKETEMWTKGEKFK